MVDEYPIGLTATPDKRTFGFFNENKEFINHLYQALKLDEMIVLAIL
ncbi:MAG: hypothetical protein SFY66_05100 [Oculatellaceae cyanobacterium bins.114]|nr:hypothetical protein [Oculatellaceae cyanobacterium bins.114]